MSTRNGVPTVEDLVRTLEQGMPGTAMPSWAHLPREELESLARHVLSLWRDGLVQASLEKGLSRAEAEAKAANKMAPGEVIQPQPPRTVFSAEEQKKAFAVQCAVCHAEDGTGRDDPAWRTAEGYPITSRNFQKGVFKGGRDDLSLYRRIAAGMPGTPMPAFGALPEVEIWKMVRYIQSLSEPAAQERATVRAGALRVHKVAELPDSVGAPTWRDAPAVEVALLPLRAPAATVDTVTVRAAADADEIAFLLEWSDETKDESVGPATFSDGAAVELVSANEEPPLFAMGARGAPVAIWHWKADQAAKVLGADGASGIDVYLGPSGWTSAPKKEDPLFQAASAAQNPLAADGNKGAAYDLVAEGFGTLTAHADTASDVRVEAAWADGRWRVVLRRTTPDPAPTHVAFAIWNGSAGDRNGQKAFSIWQTLEVGP